MRPGRQLAVLAGLFVILAAMVFWMGDTKGMSIAERLHPRLGLDLVGGTQVTMRAATLGGQPPSQESLELARQIMESRVNARGVSEAEVITEGNTNIVISLAGKADDSLKELGEPAELRFRKLLKVTADTGPTEPTPTPTGTATPKPTATPTAKPTATPTATPKPTATAAPTPSSSPAPVSNEAKLEAVRQKVGAAAWNAASALAAPDTTGNPALAPFGKLTADDVAVLPATMQFNVSTITCQQLDNRPAGSIKDPAVRVVACETGAKYLLDKAKVLGTDVSDANPQLDQSSKWAVGLEFSSDGAKKWENLTREAFNNTGATEDDKCAQDALGDGGRCRVAVVLDTQVVSSPEIEGVLGSQSQITGTFTSAEARTLASQLKYGALPLTFTQQEAQTVSATLGTAQLRAGLLAAGIGMFLVVIYAFFYYRLLGTVIFLSLLLSGLLVFGALIVLGRQIGFTLTLAGIAGFIVSLGVAADSFVIYFERLKDEIREGRTPRSAVPRAWARARRTIISANTISILAAVVLYLVSIGTVQGFAFALGLATIIDLMVVFLFRHPIMTMFARTRAFMSPRVSGLGRVLERDDADAAPAAPRGPRVKEA
ncbi:MAG TPA: protein translocase subunit SecD [Pilimelia sp.]|nr:protein translocase subunit SecD [Pilimelia sp.]